MKVQLRNVHDECDGDASCEYVCSRLERCGFTVNSEHDSVGGLSQVCRHRVKAGCDDIREVFDSDQEIDILP